jgi:hypothetical protein
MVVVSGVFWLFVVVGDDLVGVCGGLVKVENRQREGGLCGVGESDGEGRGAVT